MSADHFSAKTIKIFGAQKLVLRNNFTDNKKAKAVVNILLKKRRFD